MGCHFLLQCRKVKRESEVAQPCPTLSDPMDHSPPGSSIHGIFQARVLEWGAIAFSEGQPISCINNMALNAVQVFFSPTLKLEHRLCSMKSPVQLILCRAIFRRRQWHPTPVFLPGESQGWGSLVGCRLWGHTERKRLKRLSSRSSSR